MQKAYCGKHGTGQMNDNGLRFTEFCSTNNFVIDGTLFQHQMDPQSQLVSTGIRKNEAIKLIISL